jgi:hypothetical protein
MKIEFSVRKTVLGAILFIATMVLTGCASENLCNVDKAYDFALKVSRQHPNEFANQKGKNSSVYYEKSLTVTNSGLFGFWPTEGKGVFIEIHKDGELSVLEHDCNQMAKLASGEIKASETKGRAFNYMNDKKYGEVIGLSDNGSMVSYTKSNNEWEKKCYDVSKIEGGMQFESIPILSSKKVDEKEVKKFLDLIDKIRNRFPLR